jgi:hypothetical protein
MSAPRKPSAQTMAASCFSTDLGTRTANIIAIAAAARRTSSGASAPQSMVGV